jgi:hypothetical protein
MNRLEIIDIIGQENWSKFVKYIETTYGFIPDSFDEMDLIEFRRENLL